MYFSHFVFFLFFHHFILFMFTDFFFFSNAHSVNNNDYSNVLQWLLTFCHSSSNNTKTYCFVVDSSVCRRERKKEKFNDRNISLLQIISKKGQSFHFLNRLGRTRNKVTSFQIVWVKRGNKASLFQIICVKYRKNDFKLPELNKVQNLLF